MSRLLRGDTLPGACGKCTAKERGADEYPEVLKGFTAGEDGGADGTGGVHGSTGEVDAHQVDENEAETDCKACGFACAILGICCTKNNQDKDEGSNDLNKACAPYATGIGDAVGAKTAGKIRSGNNLGKQKQQSTGNDTADNLANPIAASIFPTHASAEGNAQGDGRIDVAAADFANGICHGNYGKTECNSGSNYTCRSVATKEHGSPATKECKNERSYHFSDVLFHSNY